MMHPTNSYEFKYFWLFRETLGTTFFSILDTATLICNWKNTFFFCLFKIPLSGYGGTSNVILEELRKRSDGYVATLSGIQKGRVSKLCVCVRNTGSRAAFIRAVPYSDVEKRTVMDSTIISLSPSQFILKERTQEVS